MNHTLRLPLGGLGRRFRLRHLFRIIEASPPCGMSHRLICNAYAALSRKRRTAPCDAQLAMLQVRYKAASHREAYRVLHGSAAKRVGVS